MANVSKLLDIRDILPKTFNVALLVTVGLFGITPILKGEPNAGQPFQLRGIVKIGDYQKFSLIHLENSATFWVTLNETKQGIRPRRYDSSTETLFAEYRGATLELPLANPDPMPLMVVNDQSVARAKSKERQRIQKPTLNPRVAKLIRERRRSGRIEAELASDKPVKTSSAPLGSAATQQQKRPRQQKDKNLAATTTYVDLNPRIVSKNEKN